MTTYMYRNSKEQTKQKIAKHSGIFAYQKNITSQQFFFCEIFYYFPFQYSLADFNYVHKTLNNFNITNKIQHSTFNLEGQTMISFLKQQTQPCTHSRKTHFNKSLALIWKWNWTYQKDKQSIHRNQILCAHDQFTIQHLKTQKEEIPKADDNSQRFQIGQRPNSPKQSAQIQVHRCRMILGIDVEVYIPERSTPKRNHSR